MYDYQFYFQQLVYLYHDVDLNKKGSNTTSVYTRCLKLSHHEICRIMETQHDYMKMLNIISYRQRYFIIYFINMYVLLNSVK